MHGDIPMRGVRTLILGKGNASGMSHSKHVFWGPLKKETMKEIVVDEKLEDIYHCKHGPIIAGGWMFHP